jgi:hypothetical protein
MSTKCTQHPHGNCPVYYDLNVFHKEIQINIAKSFHLIHQPLSQIVGSSF